MKNTLLILIAFFLFQSCSNSQEEEVDSIQTASSTPEKKIDVINDTPFYQFESKMNFLDSIYDLEDIVVSDWDQVFVRANKTIYIFQAEKNHTKHSFIKKFELKDKEGNLLNDIGVIDYDNTNKNLVILTSTSVFFYDNEGDYQGELIKPSPDFKPYDIAFDTYKNGFYVSSMEERAGELFYWKDKNAAPVSILKGEPYELQIRTIGTCYDTYYKAVYILSQGGVVYEYRKYNGIWEQSMTITPKDNNTGLVHSLHTNLKTDLDYLYIINGGAITFFKTQALKSKKNLLVGKIKVEDNFIKNYSFGNPNKIYILVHGEILIYKKK